MPAINSDALAWEKGGGLLPAIIQDANTSQVLMLGYMNADALAKTLDTKKVTFYSRSKDRFGQRAKHQATGWILSVPKWIVMPTPF